MAKIVRIGKIKVSNDRPFFLMAGPCQMESLEHSLYLGEAIKKICDKFKIPYVFKASFDKANRSSISSKRGVGLEEGLKNFEKIKKELGIPVITDVHLPQQAAAVAEVVDILQLPAFLCRQTMAKTGRAIHVKKMQQLAPWTMESVVKKFEAYGNSNVMLCDRGTMFGYGSLVVDMRSLPIMGQWAPVTIDCTHAVQSPGGKVTGGNRDMAQVIANAAVAVGVAGIFAEVHENPPTAPSDAANMIYLDKLEKFLERLIKIDKIAKKYPLEYSNYEIMA